MMSDRTYLVVAGVYDYVMLPATILLWGVMSVSVAVFGTRF